MNSLLVAPRRRGRIRILALSDWRVQDYEDLLELTDRIPGCDVVLYGGDDLDRILAARNIMQQIVEKTTLKRLLFVAGNDDLPEDKQSLADVDYAHDLHEEPFIYKGFAFFGVQGSTDGLGFFQSSEVQVKSILNSHLLSVEKSKSQGKTLPIVVSHTPPQGILDLAVRHAVRPGGRQIGSLGLREFLEEKRIPLTVCGHVHLCGGRQETLSNGNIVINIASHDERGAEGKIAVIDLARSGRAEVSFHSTSVLLYEHELSQLQHLGIKRLRGLLQNGIKQLEDVTEENRNKLRLPSCGEWHFDRWIRQSELIRSGFIGIEILNREKMTFLDKGHFVVWDIETDLDQSHIWLIGAHDTKTGERRQFFDPDDEKACIEAFVNWMAERPKAVPISFSGSRLDPRALKASLARYGVEDTVRVCERDIDLGGRLLYDCVHTYPSVRVKDLGDRLGYKFRHPDLDGMSVGLMFSRYLSTGRKPKDWKPYIEYNEDDVAATLLILNKVCEAYFGNVMLGKGHY